ncbi:MAG TPA: hypothetical protein VKV17_14630 [Bryobacteraceae bacterium]|nr:hypothetical protein [Bryobacteraceae bacterium]
MPNIAFHQEVLKQVITGPSAFAGLGAVGPDLYQYQAISGQLSNLLDGIYQKVLGGAAVPVPLTTDPTLAPELAAKPMMAAYSLLFREIVAPPNGFWQKLQDLATNLGKLQTVANNSDSAGLQALVNLLGDELTTGLTNDAKELQKLPKAMQAYLEIAPQLIKIPPPIQLPSSTTPAPKPWDPTQNRTYEFLRWHRTKSFARNLVKNAANTNQQAYAEGYLCHMAAAVTGEPFINNIVGGPYRTHWWRNRFVANFVDAWTWGRYNTQGGAKVDPTTDTPTPAYSSWADIRQSNLWKNIDAPNFNPPANTLAGAVTAVANGTGTAGFDALSLQVPADVVDLLTKTIVGTWLLPAARPAGFDNALDIGKATRESVVGLFAVVWFMTSGFGPMTPLTLEPPPSSCTTPPSWVTSGGTPPAPNKSGPSTAATVCGVILAILALVLFIFQQWGAGAAAVAGAIAAFTSGHGIDFGKLACDVWWLRNLLQQAEAALVNSIMLGGLGYPAPQQLGTSTLSGSTVVWTPANGVSIVGNTSTQPLTKSNPAAGAGIADIGRYPWRMDGTNAFGPDNNYGAFPPLVLETEATMNLPLPIGYADMVIDGSAPHTPGLQNGGMVSASPYPNPSRNVYFGDAVSNAKQLLADKGAKAPNYNLDADRGYGWIDWNPETNTFPATGQVSPKAELDI